jgi:hypothetical protein
MSRALIAAIARPTVCTFSVQYPAGVRMINLARLRADLRTFSLAIEQPLTGWQAYSLRLSTARPSSSRRAHANTGAHAP